jgi:hypothetical protein
LHLFFDDSHQASSSPGFYQAGTLANAVTFMGVINSDGLIQLALTDGSGQVFVAEAGSNGAEFHTTTSAYAYTYTHPSSICGAAGSAPGPAAGSGRYFNGKCETYVCTATEDVTYPNKFDLNAEWWDPDASSPAQYAWALTNTGNSNYLFLVASVAGYNTYYGSGTVRQGYLSFPY